MAIDLQTILRTNTPSGYSGFSGLGLSGYSGFSGLGLSGYSGVSGATGSGSSLNLTSDTTTNATYYPVWVTTASGTITTISTSTSKLTFNPSSGTLSATEVNTLSDQTLKMNISPILNSLALIESLKGVTFNWKDNGKSSAGLLAQDVEKCMSSLVNNDGDNKTLNYNGIIGMLVEAVKELSEKVKHLESKNI